MSRKQSAWRSPWVIGWVTLLILFIGVSVFRIYLAVKTDPGLVDENYYERGQDHAQNRLKRLARDPGWQMTIDAPEYVDVATPSLWGFSVLNTEGEPVTPDSVVFYAYRPSDAKQDFSVSMREIGLGRYQAEVSFPLKGVWDILVSVKNGEDEYNTPYWISAGVR
ncbi:MAG: FixH family protein [Gammaproteobacteria bacterium]|nr:FixH family protein [Gammaproteobacteria bacterium]